MRGLLVAVAPEGHAMHVVIMWPAAAVCRHTARDTVLVEGEERTTVASRLQQMQQSAMYNEVLSEAELSDLDLTLQACLVEMKYSLNALAAYSGCTKLVLSRTKLVLSRSGCLPGLLPTYLSIYPPRPRPLSCAARGWPSSSQARSGGIGASPR
eukprot:scaffold38258_cov67-Phaeocystis_antarctica.AAC.12